MRCKIEDINKNINLKELLDTIENTCRRYEHFFRGDDIIYKLKSDCAELFFKERENAK